jgi:predicted nucleotidyltransferase
MQFADRIQQFFRTKAEVVAVYLFGSEATGNSRKGSDVDMAVMVSRDLSGFERVDLETELANLLKRDVELVIFHQASPLLQHQILKYGNLLFEAHPQERVRQEVSARYDYLDTLCLHKELGSATHD